MRVAGAPAPDVASMKRRVLFVMIQMAMGGSERLVYNLVRNLDRGRFEPSIAWFTNEHPLPEFEDLGVPLHFVPKRERVDWSTVRRLAEIVRVNQIDVVNAHHFLPFVYAYYAAKISNRARLVYTEHSEADVNASAGKWRWIGGRLLRWSDAAVGVNDGVTRALIGHFDLPPSFVRTIANGVDVELFRSDDGTRARLRRQFGLSDHHVVLGHVANFRHNKNHLFLLRAFAILAKTRPDVRLLLVGQGFPGDPENSEGAIREFIRAHNLEASALVVGYRPDVQDVLRMLDVFCLVSFREGLPLSLLEAMATALPAIGTDIDGIRDVIGAETTGLLVAPGDVTALHAALARMTSDGDLRARMGLAARRLVEDQYSLSRCVRQTEDLFSSWSRRAPVQTPARHTTAASA